MQPEKAPDSNVEFVIQQIPHHAGLGSCSNLIQKFRDRVEHGIQKYKVTTDREDLTVEQWYMHAIEEQMDGCVYLAKLIKIETNIDKRERLETIFFLTLQNLTGLWEILFPDEFIRVSDPRIPSSFDD